MEINRNIYDFLIFDLNLPLENSVFLPNSFQAHTNKSHTNTTHFLDSIRMPHEIYVNITVNTLINTLEKTDKNTLLIEPYEREKDAETAKYYRKAIQQSMSF